MRVGRGRPREQRRRVTRLVGCTLLAVLSASGAGCARKGNHAGEPSGGRWKPIVLASSDAVRLPPPPARESAQERAEIAELAGLAKAGTASAVEAARYWNVGASLRWNEIARDLVARHRMEHAPPSRVYAVLSVAQYDALVAAWNNKYVHRRPAPSAISSAIVPLLPPSGAPVYPCEHATVAAASAAVLAYFFPDEAAFLEKKVREHQESRLQAGLAFRSDVVAGDSLGRTVAGTVIARARNDRSDARWQGSVPDKPGQWRASEQAPVTPLWGEVKPWLMESGAQFRAKPPPAFDSAEFHAAMAEVRTYSDARTRDQARTAALWADGAGSYAPSGRWNKIAADLIGDHRLNELRGARVLALMNIATMDAGIACFESKYHYWVMRPWQIDPEISTPVGKPNHPSYPSAHACFSGAASEVLGYLFPEKKGWLRDRAEEAAFSRVYGGIHYRFDGDAGLALGRAVAQLAIAHGRADGAGK